MFDLQRIFIPIDFSRSSRAAFDVAQRWAQRSDACLHVIHVVPPVLRYMERTLFPYAGLGEDRVAVLDELRSNARDALSRYHRLGETKLFESGDGAQAARREEPERHRLDLHVADEQSSAKQTLVKALDGSDAQLAIIGHSGQSGQVAGALGSSALHLLIHSARPVMLVRDIPVVPIRKVAVGLDMSSACQEVLQTALEVALVHDASLEIVIVVPEPLVYDVRGIVSGALKVDPAKLLRTAKREVFKILGRLEAELKIPFPWQDKHAAMTIERRVEIGDPVERLVSLSAEQDIDLLVLGTRGERRAQLARAVGRTATAIAANAPCHTLFV